MDDENEIRFKNRTKENLENDNQTINSLIDLRKKTKLEVVKNFKLQEIIKLETEKFEKKKKEKEEREKILKQLSKDLETLAEEVGEYQDPNDKIRLKSSEKLVMQPIVNYANDLEEAKKSQKLNENNQNYDIIDSQKFKFIKNLGKVYEKISNVFSIDINKFDGYQSTMEKINEQIDTNQTDIENNINNIISINVFIRESDSDFEEKEYAERIIHTQGLSASRIGFLEYDEKYEILKKYSVAEMKVKACSMLRVRTEDYMLVTMKLEWIPFNLDVYQEIFMINIAKKCINSSCRFYQFDSFISENFNLVLIRKSLFKYLILNNADTFSVYKEYQALLKKEKLKWKINNFLEIIKDEDRTRMELERINPNAILYFEDFLKEKIKNLIDFIYSSNLAKKEYMFRVNEANPSEENNTNLSVGNLISDSNSGKTSKSLNYASKSNNESKNSSKKKKHPRKFGKRESSSMQSDEISAKTTDKNIVDDENAKLKQSTMITKIMQESNSLDKEPPRMKLRDEYFKQIFEENKIILNEFHDNPENFIEKCDEYIGEKQKLKNKEHNNLERGGIYQDQYNEVDENLFASNNAVLVSQGNKEPGINLQEKLASYQEGKPGLTDYLFDFLREKDLFTDKKIRNNFLEDNKFIVIDNFIEDYIEEESQFVQECTNEAKQKKLKQGNKKGFKSENNDEDGFNLWNFLFTKASLLRITETILVILILILCYVFSNNSKVQIETLSNFNEKILKSFNEKTNCNEFFLTISTPEGLNDWLYSCYTEVLKTFMMKHAQLVKNTKYSIYIYYSDIQIKYVSIDECPTLNNNKTIGSKIKLPQTLKKENTKKKCLKLTLPEGFYTGNENRRKLFDSVSLTVTEPWDYKYKPLNFLDYLFYGSSRIEYANIIKIENRTHLFQLENILEARYFYSDIKKASSKYLDRIDFLIRDFSKTNAFDKALDSTNPDFDSIVKQESLEENNNEENYFVDDLLSEMVISTFFMNQDIDKMGVIMHKYSSTNSIVTTSINHFSLEIEEVHLTTQTLIDYVYLFVLLLLIFCFYLKYRLVGDFEQVYMGSKFLLIFIIVFILEYVYRVYHTVVGTNNIFFKPVGAFDINLRERFIYYKDNIKFFKGIAAMSICMHLNFVIFPLEDLTMIKKLFKQVLILFFLILIFVSLGMTFVLNSLFGVEMDEYTQFFGTFVKVFGFILGIETSSDSERRTFEVQLSDSVLFFIRIVYSNFTIVVMTYTYNQLMEKENKRLRRNQKLKSD